MRAHATSHTSRRAAIVLLCVANGWIGCGPGNPDATPAADSQYPDSGAIFDVSVHVSDTIANVAIVEWHTAAPSTASVRFGDSQLTAETIAPAQPTTTHRHVLTGLKAGTQYSAQVRADIDGVSYISDQLTFETGTLPASLPVLSTTPPNHPVPAHYTVVPIIGPPGLQSTIAILDNQGDYVWYTELASDETPVAAAFSRDRSSILYLSGDNIIRLSLDGRDKTVVLVTDSLHHYTEVPDGGIAALVSAEQAFDGGTVYGDRIIEVWPDGTEVEIWNVFDHPDTLGLLDDAWPTDGEDLTQGSSIAYVAEDDSYYVNLAAIGTVVKVDRATGDVVWVFDADGDHGLDFQPQDPYSITHQLTPTSTGFLLFVNRTQDSDCARVVEIFVDEDANTAAAQILHDGGECVSVYGLGGVQRLASGDDLVIWSSAGRFDQIDTHGALVSETTASLGYGFGYGQQINDLYIPE